MRQEDGIEFELKNLFESVAFLRAKGVFDYLLRGITNQHAQAVDNSVVTDVSPRNFIHQGLQISRLITF